VEQWGQYHINEWVAYLAIERGEKTPEDKEKESFVALNDLAARINATQKGKR
jgi:hypothetical protein